MQYISRALEEKIGRALRRHKSVLLLGPRQTGKTTLLRQFKSDLSISFIQPQVRQRYEKSPYLLKGEVEALETGVSDKRPLVVLDEVQRVPVLLDVVQDLIDLSTADFILKGS
jgi:predicted AAA+ superfamily ATPase